MLVNEQTKEIQLIRGDTGTLEILGPPELEATLSVKKSVYEKKYLLQTQAVDGVIRIEHEVSDTLPVGDWVYDIQFRMDDDVLTYGPYDFIVLGDVTR